MFVVSSEKAFIFFLVLFFFMKGVLIVAWTDPIKTVTAGVDEVLASDWNTYVKDNVTSL